MKKLIMLAALMLCGFVYSSAQPLRAEEPKESKPQPPVYKLNLSQDYDNSAKKEVLLNEYRRMFKQLKDSIRNDKDFDKNKAQSMEDEIKSIIGTGRRLLEYYTLTEEEKTEIETVSGYGKNMLCIIYDGEDTIDVNAMYDKKIEAAKKHGTNDGMGLLAASMMHNAATPLYKIEQQLRDEADKSEGKYKERKNDYDDEDDDWEVGSSNL